MVKQSPSLTTLFGKYIKSMVYGGLDGIITTFAIVASASGANLPPTILLILGFANLVADGLSMGFGDFLSSRAEDEFQEKEQLLIEQDYLKNPEKCHNVLTSIFVKDGFTKEQAAHLATTISTNKKRAMLLLLNDHGITPGNNNHTAKSLVTFCSFCIFGFVPLLTYVINLFVPISAFGGTFHVASALTLLTLFALGATKVILTGRNWFYSGMEMVVIGGFSAVAAYGVGHMLSKIIA